MLVTMKEEDGRLLIDLRTQISHSTKDNPRFMAARVGSLASSLNKRLPIYR
jgi:hypothetical protein